MFYSTEVIIEDTVQQEINLNERIIIGNLHKRYALYNLMFYDTFLYNFENIVVIQSYYHTCYTYWVNHLYLCISLISNVLMQYLTKWS